MIWFSGERDGKINPRKIWIVEDEELISEGLKTLLTNAGDPAERAADFGGTLRQIRARLLRDAGEQGCRTE